MTQLRTPHIALTFILAITALPAAIFAQETTGTIIGTVTDDSGAVLPGVTVVVKHLGTGQTFERVTSAEGFYTAPLLPVGQYEVTFTLTGFQPRVVRGVSLSVNDRFVIDATMSVGGVSEVVEVTGTSSVQPTAALQTLIGSAQVQELPLNNRNFAQLATLAPGVSNDLSDEVGVGLTSNMNLSINGARRNAVNWLVDGVSNVDVGSNITLLSTPTLESIQEFKIITSSYAAEWPRSGGGIVNVVTKSGTTRFTGSGYEFFRNDALNANSYFRKLATDPALRDRAPYLRYNNFGYTLGGPVLPSREKAFFFWSQEWRRIKRAPQQSIANVPNPEWLTDPSSINYVPPAERDPIAMRLLEAFPAPNLPPTAPGNPGRHQALVPNINNTRQEVLRLDYDWNANWRLTGRFTRDLSQTREIGGLFFGSLVPGVATTDTSVPGIVGAFGVKTVVSHDRLNELQYQYSSNNISTTNPEGTRNKRSDYSVSIPEVFPENVNDLIPVIDIAGLSIVGANQLFRIQYINHTFTDNFSWQRGRHSLKFGGLMTLEQKNENAASRSQGTFGFVATTNGPTAFQSFLRGNSNSVCVTCTYTEAERDIDVQLRWNRFEFYAQDTWRARSNLTVDYGVRYALYPPITEVNDLLVTFDPAIYNNAAAPPYTNAAGTLIDRTQGDILVGIIQAGVNSPYGRGIYEFKKDGIQPRIGFSWDPASTGDTIVRGAFGIYYDQPLVGIFEQNSFTMPPIVNNVTFTNPRLTNPAAGQTPTTTGLRTIQTTSLDFDNPRMMQWNVGTTRRLWSRGVAEVSYVGSRGDNLIRPTDINYPQPAAVVALQQTVPGAFNPVRPYRSYAEIRVRETTARSRYHGLLTALKYEGGRAGTAAINYTLSRNQTDASNDRDTIDIPQNPLDPDADYADARTDRRHILTASYVYELPFFRNADAVLRTLLSGWQVAGIVNINSGQPIPRVSVSNNSFRRGGFADFAPGVDIMAGEQFVNGVPYWFNPLAFVPPADGTFGNSGRAPFRQPGRHQWDITLSKNFYLPSETRIQLRADFINAFDQLQWLADPSANGLDNTCTTSVTSCTVATDRFGQLIATRAPREIQIGLKLYW
jgi:hypothetical protein